MTEKRKSFFERLMLMDDSTWQRHANPLSVYTRYSGLPLLALAIWSRIWVGWWALVPIAMVILWIWINPRLFANPQSTANWASKAVLGERVWLNRKTVAIPEGHRQAAFRLSVLNGIASLVVIYGLIVLAVWPTLAGIGTVILAKTWFLDRMVWLFEDMADDNSLYRSWVC
ncbi:DUF6653 family protein [Pelagibacterium sediminicola]|uniref:DUF6653 family protein n=1 Tax=Pelagibacterium sediminicola TaxID=2248761 RepID=UPI000E3199FA|nr:DUF6653 family protein [Pelagibacterium sediminicola]